MKPQRKFMERAIRKAQAAARAGDYAIGAVLVWENEIISVSASRSKRDENPIAHAETLAIIKASKKLKTRHLINCVLYTTHEPCPMCAAVAVWARLKGVVYGSRQNDMKKYRLTNGNQHYRWRTIDIPCKQIFAKSTEKIQLIEDFMRTECMQLFHNK